MIVLLTARIDAVDPSPRAETSTFWTRWKICWDLEIDVLEPRASPVCRNNSKVLWLNRVLVASVGDTQTAALDILGVAATPLIRSMHRTNTAFGVIVTVTGIDACLLVIVLAIRRQCLVAGNLAFVGASRRQSHEFAYSGRFVLVPMEPPLIEGEIHQGEHGLRLVWI